MACTYELGNQSLDLIELASIFHKSTGILKNAAIYSKEEIQDSVKAVLLKEAAKADEYIKTNEDLVPVKDYITKVNLDFLNKLGMDRDRLAPEYIEINLKNNYVKKKILENPSPSIDTTKVSVSNDLQNTKDFLKLAGFSSIEDDIINYYLEEVEEIIADTEKTTKLGTFLHELLSMSLKDGISNHFNKKLENFIIDPENKDIFGEASVTDWVNSIMSIVNSINDKINKNGEIITELMLISDPQSIARVRGRIDLAVVDSKGDVHIYEIKISKNNYSNWDSAKLLEADWQLALYRQLLAQHVDIKNMQLNLIPIQFSKLGDPKSLTFTEVINRKSEPMSGLGEDGAVTRIAEWLIPSRVVVEVDEVRTEQLKNDLEELIPGYKIKTNYEDSSVDAIMRRARENGKWEKFNNFEGIEGLPVGVFSGETEEEFEKKVKQYVEHVKGQVNRNILKVKESIGTVLSDPSNPTLKFYNKDKQIFLNNLLKDYLNSEWELIDIPEGRAMGIIAIRNIKTHTVNLLSITIHRLSGDSTIDGLTYGNIDTVKSMLFLNTFKTELLSGGFKLGEIITFNLETQKYHKESNFKAYELYEQRMIKASMNHKNKLNKISDLKSIDNIVMDLLRSTLNNYNNDDKNAVESLFNVKDGFNWAEADYKQLVLVNNAFLAKYPELKGRQFTPTMDFSNKEEYLFAMLQMAINIKLGYLPVGDFYAMSNMGIGFSDFRSLVSAVYSRDQPNFDKEEKRVMGLFQGLNFITPDWVPSNDLRTINKIMSLGNSKIAELMCSESAKISSKTREYYKKIGYSNISQNWVGESQSKHSNLFIQTDAGKVHNDFILKNPYINNLKNRLDDSERIYLQSMLFEINKFMLELDSETISKFEMKKLSLSKLDDLMSIPKIAKAITTGDYFRMPLIRREELTRHKGLIEGGLGGFWGRIKGRLSEVKDIMDPREISDEEREIANSSMAGYNEMYDLYGKQTPEFKHTLISKNTVNYYEFNLDTIAHRVAFNKIRKTQMDFRLPAITSYIWWMKLHAGRTGLDISKELKYVEQQMKLAIFDKPIIDPEAEALVVVSSLAKQVSTAGMLAFRPSLLVKELTIGTMKGISLAATQVFGKDIFSVDDITAAYKKLVTIDKQASIEWNLIDGMNNLYRFANMDANTISKKMQTDRRGIMKGFGRYMYACNTIPDYYNRMAIFLAVSLHDGSYDAHSMSSEGELIYNPKKDKRFEYYFNNRDKNIDSKGRYSPKQNDEKYNFQRNLYLKLVESLNKENIVDPNYKKLNEEDLVNKAYSENERASIKTMSDMAYGYYDSDAQAQWSKMWYGVIFGQFMQFWPGKMKMWFGKPTHDRNGKEIIKSPIGKFQQKTTIGENGEILKLWKKPIYDDKYDVERITDFEEVTENTGDPLLEWTGKPQEGLMYAMLYTTQDILRGDIKGAFSDNQRNRRVMFGLADTLFMMIILGIVKALIDATIAETGDGTIINETAQFAQNVNKKVLSETNLWRNTLGAVKTEPVFWSYGTKVAEDIQSVMMGNKTIKEAISRDIKAFEFLQED